MKCPNCGAEVAPNTKCEYCDSFVEKEETNYSEILGEFISETAKHVAEGLNNASKNTTYSGNAHRTNAESYEETMKRVSSPENKQTLKKLLIISCIIIVFPFLFYFVFMFSSLWFDLFRLF